jgi:hypothetical protein
MSLTSLTNSINTNIRNAINKIIKGVHADTLQEVVNSQYPTVDTYTDISENSVFYKFDFVKIGNVVNLNIAIRNQAFLSVGGQSFLFTSLNIPSKYHSLFAPHGLISQTGFSPISYQVGTLGITIGATIPSTGGQFRGTITYIANNE